MADFDISTNRGLTDKRIGRGIDKANSAVFVEEDNMDDIKGLRARLTALSATSYTTARLDAMTKNDMIYALRTASSDSAGI
jgi:hypothetical protein